MIYQFQLSLVSLPAQDQRDLTWYAIGYCEALGAQMGGGLEQFTVNGLTAKQAADLFGGIRTYAENAGAIVDGTFYEVGNG